MNLIIKDDDALETNETFTAVLELVPVDNDRIILEPKETEVSIVSDDDSKHVGIGYCRSGFNYEYLLIANCEFFYVSHLIDSQT